jgi:hypothetical protein
MVAGGKAAMSISDMDEDGAYSARTLEEPRYDRRVARAFVEAAKAGDVERFIDLAGALNDMTVDGWRLAMKAVGRLPLVTEGITAAFVAIWIESQAFLEKVRDRRVLAGGLRVLLPRNHRGTPLRVYRGTQARERRLGEYGFSWSTKRAVAQRLCDRWNEWVHVEHRRTGSINPLDRGVVIAAIAPPQAILLVRTDKGHRGEVVLDPFCLDIGKREPRSAV